MNCILDNNKKVFIEFKMVTKNMSNQSIFFK